MIIVRVSRWMSPPGMFVARNAPVTRCRHRERKCASAERGQAFDIPSGQSVVTGFRYPIMRRSARMYAIMRICLILKCSLRPCAKT